MRRSLAIAVAAALALAAAAYATTSRSGSGSTVHVVEHAVSDAVTNGTKSDAAGNVLTFANPVFDAADATKVGTDSGYCIRIVKGKSWECNWTTFLQGGQLTVEGPFSDTGNTRLAITGGTGTYANARGWMELRFHNKKGTKFDFVFHLS